MHISKTFIHPEKYNKNRNRYYNISRPNIRTYSNHKSCRDQPARTFVSYPLHGGLPAFSLLNHAYHLLERAVPAQLGSLYINCSKAVKRTAEHLFSHTLIYRQGFSCHNRLSYRSLTADDFAVSRNGLAGQNPQNISLSDFFCPNHLFSPVPDSPPLDRSKADQLL